MEEYKKINVQDLVGLKIAAIKGTGIEGKRAPKIDFILFDDEETYLSFSAQDYYEYHDCNENAREISLIRDKKMWKELMSPASKRRVGHWKYLHCEHEITTGYSLKWEE